MRRTLCAAAVAVVIVGAVGCGGSDEPSSPDSKPVASQTAKSVKVAIVLPGLDNPFFRDIRDGAQQAAKGMPGVSMDVVGPPASTPPSGPIDLMQAETTKGVDGMGFVPTDPDLYGPAVRRVNAAGIPMVGLGSDTVGDNKLAAGLTFDQAGATKAAMEVMIKQMDGKGPVAIMEVPGDANLAQRVKAAQEAFKAAGIEVAGTYPGDCGIKALNVTEDILQKTPKLAGMYAPCGTASVQAARAFTAAHRDPSSYSLWGFDGTPDEYKDIKNGKMDGTVSYDGKQIGALLAKTVVQVARDEKPSGALTAPFTLVTKDNVDEHLGS
jgi:ABC-type sugar transport system substrate-binding protein